MTDIVKWVKARSGPFQKDCKPLDKTVKPLTTQPFAEWLVKLMIGTCLNTLIGTCLNIKEICCTVYCLKPSVAMCKVYVFEASKLNLRG